MGQRPLRIHHQGRLHGLAAERCIERHARQPRHAPEVIGHLQCRLRERIRLRPRLTRVRVPRPTRRHRQGRLIAIVERLAHRLAVRSIDDSLRANTQHAPRFHPLKTQTAESAAIWKMVAHTENSQQLLYSFFLSAKMPTNPAPRATPCSVQAIVSPA